MGVRRMAPPLAAAIAAILSISGSALAAETELTATGTVYSVDDPTDFLGLDKPGASDTFKATFYVDTSKGQLSTVPGIKQSVHGGEEYLISSPVYASLYLNGRTYNFDGLYNGGAVVDNEQGSAHVQASVFDGGNQGALGAGVIDSENAQPFPTTLGEPFSVTAGQSISDFDITPFSIPIPGMTGDSVTGGLQADVFSSPGVISSTSPVPEPSAWALMTLGIGGLGLIFRRAKAKRGLGFKAAFST